MASPDDSLRPAELAARLELERAGVPFLAYRDGHGDLRLLPLRGVDRVAVGRVADGLRIDWDPEVSRAHAQLERFGEEWTVADDGLSRNGTFVNERRVAGRRRLVSGDVLRFGRTKVGFRCPDPGMVDTAAARDDLAGVKLTDAERRVLVALCRPLHGREAAAPASNREIAAELCLSLDGVKSRVRALFEKLGIDELPQNKKRAELAHRALAGGLVSERDLRGPGAGANPPV